MSLSNHQFPYKAELQKVITELKEAARFQGYKARVECIRISQKFQRPASSNPLCSHSSCGTRTLETSTVSSRQRRRKDVFLHHWFRIRALGVPVKAFRLHIRMSFSYAPRICGSAAPDGPVSNLGLCRSGFVGRQLLQLCPQKLRFKSKWRTAGALRSTICSFRPLRFGWDEENS